MFTDMRVWSRTAAAGQLLEHLAAIERTTLPEQGFIAVLVRAGA